MPATLAPNYGLIFDRPPLAIPQKGLQDGLNFRCKNGTLESRNMGWERFSTFTLNGAVLLIDNFFPHSQDEKLIFGTTTDLYVYDPVTDGVKFITPNYSTGSVAGSGTALTGTGTTWTTNAKAGDEITIGSSGYVGTNPHGNDSFTKVLLKFNGVDASTTFTDVNNGGFAHTWTAAGNAQLDTADFKFGTASGLFDGTGDYISTPDSSDLTLGSLDFTVDVWFKVNAAGGTVLRLAGQIDAGFTAAGSAWVVQRETSNVIRFAVSNGTSFVSIDSLAQYTNAVNTGWHHVEVSRSANTIRMFIDGVFQSSTAFASTIPDSAANVAVGTAGSYVNEPWNGWIDEFRFSIGVARHTANFSVETETYNTQWFTIQSVNSNTSITLTGTALRIEAGQPYTIRRKFQQQTGAQWATDVFVNAPGNVDLWFATNGLDYVVTWNGTDPTVLYHPELGFTCTTLATYTNMMVYGNLVTGGQILPTSIINSDLGNPLAAGSVGTGISEQFVAYNSSDGILNLIPLGDYLIIYGERTIVPIQFVGDPLIFTFRVAMIGVGPISSYGVADFGDFHEFIGSDAGYVFDGVTLKEINSHVWRDVLRQTDPARRREAYAHFDEEQGDLIWSIPNNSDPGVGTEGSEPTVAWVEHYLEDVGNFPGSAFSKRSFPFTASGFYERKVGLTWNDITQQWQEFNFAWNDQFFQAAFPLNMVGRADGTVYTLNQTQLANGAPLLSFVRTGRFALSSGRERDLLTRIYPWTRQLPYNLEVNLYMGDHAAGSMQSKGTQLFNMNLLEGLHFVTFYRRGRFAEFGFSSTNGDPWILDGWDYDKVNGGRR